MATPSFKSLVLLLDADNTLWDTNAVFARAQRVGMNMLADHGFGLSGDRLKVLREVDSYLFNEMGTFEYDFGHLMQALILRAKGSDPRAAARSISDGTVALTDEEAGFARRASDALQAILSESIPPLLPGARSLLAWQEAELSRPRKRIANFLLSEGDEARLLRTVAHHGLDAKGKYFDGVRVVRSKSKELFQSIAAEGCALLGDEDAQVICIGDSLRRDIAPANSIGAITIYKPAGFMGHESPAGPLDTPTYEVASLGEALTVMKSIHKVSTV